MLTVDYFDNLDCFSCHYRIRTDHEDSTMKWISQYNDKTKEIMVFECCKNRTGKRGQKMNSFCVVNTNFDKLDSTLRVIDP